MTLPLMSITAQDGDFVVHLAGVKGVAKCLMFRR